MRVFWAGSHAAARLFELPLYVAAGIEIIPSEVVPGTHTFSEGSSYDDPDLAINQLWRGSVSLPDSVLAALRRSRLWERNGQIAPDEIDLFNRYIDVICVPTRLKLALAVGRWFKGVILYCYPAWKIDPG